jgi:ribonuclease HI
MTDGGEVSGQSGGVAGTTNNRMELTAVISALSGIKTGGEIEIFTDSQYVKNGVEIWMRNWKINGWRTADRKPVSNQDLWRQLDGLTPRFKIRWNWTRGHSDDEMNNRCDEMARAAARSVS